MVPWPGILTVGLSRLTSCRAWVLWARLTWVLWTRSRAKSSHVARLILQTDWGSPGNVSRRFLEPPPVLRGLLCVTPYVSPYYTAARPPLTLGATGSFSWVRGQPVKNLCSFTHSAFTLDGKLAIPWARAKSRVNHDCNVGISLNNKPDNDCMI